MLDSRQINTSGGNATADHNLAGSFVHSSISAGFGTSISSTGSVVSVTRKTSMSMSTDGSQQLPQLLQRLAVNEFCVNVPDHHCPLCFEAKRHHESIEGLVYEKQAWRIRERMKTASVALVLCLNIGVDPPDVVKIQPCARLECWIDPSSVSVHKAMEMIGTKLQAQYERWQPRARYKKCHDPTVDDVKKLCTSLRRNAKGERILFHYNGHGVPKPTVNGEIWVFNKNFTQYIPLSIFELQSWMAAPSIYVYDCSNAGIIINSFQQFAEQHERDLEKNLAAAIQRVASGQQAQMPPVVSYKNCIHLAACSANQILPMNAQLPADLFTSCLTTPINIALKWHTMQDKLNLVPRIQAELIDKIPGKVNDRRTMMGELNWIFTAITDTIAWNTMPRELFQRLFRQDLLVASLFRNFLLAERILRSHDCTPVSHPALPHCFRHPMWTAWDLVVDLALQQLPEILERGMPYRQLPFFEEQLTAFQVWLDRESESRAPPEQLPIVLQVLLSQVHRLRALELLARFLDLGPWAVNLALGVGIFPYVLKLLQSSAKELRPVLVFIWAKILAVDPTCQVDLVKDHKYFLAVLQDTSVAKEYRTLSAFVLGCIVNNFLLGQTSTLQGSLVSICLEQLNDESWLLRQWLAICLGMLWQNFEKARWSGVRDLAHEKLYPLLKDPIPEVRAAAVFALGTFISSVTDRTEEHANNIDRNIAITLLETVGEDMSPLVRLELAAALQWLVVLFDSQFITVYLQEHKNGGERSSSIPQPSNNHHSTHSLERHVTMRRGASSNSIANMSTSSTTIPFQSIFLKLWQGICRLGHDPFLKVAETAQKIIAHVRDAADHPVTAKEATSTEKCISLSVSLPPSPNTRVNYLGGAADSPPIAGGNVAAQAAQQSSATTWAAKLRLGGLVADSHDPQAVLQRKLRTTSMNDETDSSNIAVNSNIGANGGGNGGVIGGGGGGDADSARSSTSDTYDTKAQSLKPIVTTDFIPWAISYFARPGKLRYSSSECCESQQLVPEDKNSTVSRTRQYRFLRNKHTRLHAREKQTQPARIDAQSWLRKTQFTPSLVKFLPYEPKIAVAYREKVLVYDWNRNSARTFTPLGTANAPRKYMMSLSTASLTMSASPPTPSIQYMQSQPSNVERVSSFEFLNAHDVPLVLVGHEDGIVRVWRSFDDENRESQLVTAWEALPVQTAASATFTIGTKANASFTIGGTPPAPKHTRREHSTMGNTGIVTAWQQCTQQLIVGSSSCRFIRIWDVERELKLSDIPIDNETNIRVFSLFPNNIRSDLIAAGCSDGSVHLFDKRCGPQDARIRVYREHTKSILATTLKENQVTLITGCADGKICVIDLRSRAGVLQQWEAGADITAIAAHQTADLVACGCANKITISTQNGKPWSALRSNEGFMGTKMGHPTSLAFHPYKLSLAAGFFYKLCDRWQNDVDDNPSTFVNARKFLDGPEMQEAIQYIKQKTQLDEISATDARLIYTICAFETAWQRRRSASIWCHLLNRKAFEVLEFAEDLEYYWNDGYGFELTHKIACPAIGDMFDYIDPKSNKSLATFYFTHSGTILKMLAHLGLYNDTKPLTSDDFQKERLWRTSKIDAFASNIAFVLYECELEEPLVLTLHQEQPVHIPGCPKDHDLCSLNQLRKVFANSVESCNFDEICRLPEEE